MTPCQRIGQLLQNLPLSDSRPSPPFTSGSGVSHRQHRMSAFVEERGHRRTHLVPASHWSLYGLNSATRDIILRYLINTRSLRDQIALGVAAHGASTGGRTRTHARNMRRFSGRANTTSYQMETLREFSAYGPGGCMMRLTPDHGIPHGMWHSFESGAGLLNVAGRTADLQLSQTRIATEQGLSHASSHNAGIPKA